MNDRDTNDPGLEIQIEHILNIYQSNIVHIQNSKYLNI